MKIAVQKNHLRGQILYRSLDPVKNRRFRRNRKEMIYLTVFLGGTKLSPGRDHFVLEKNEKKVRKIDLEISKI